MEKLLSQRFWIQPAPLLRIIPKVALLITSQSHLEFLDFWLRTSVAIAPHDDAEACMRQPLCFEVSLDSVGQRLQKWQPHLCPPPPLWLIWSCEFCRREGEARSPGWSNCSSSTRRSGLPSFALQGLLTQFMETSRPPTSTCTATPPPRLVQKHWSLSESHRGTCLRDKSSLLIDNCYQNCQTFKHPTDMQLGRGHPALSDLDNWIFWTSLWNLCPATIEWCNFRCENVFIHEAENKAIVSISLSLYHYQGA